MKDIVIRSKILFDSILIKQLGHSRSRQAMPVLVAFDTERHEIKYPGFPATHIAKVSIFRHFDESLFRFVQSGKSNVAIIRCWQDYGDRRKYYLFTNQSLAASSPIG